MEKNEGLTPYLSPLSVWALSFGCAVGWGSFVMPGTQFLPIAGPLGTALGLFIGAIIMILIGRNYHYLMQRYRGSGGIFTFTRRTFGYDHGFLSAWFLVLTYVSIAWANLTALALIARNVFGDVLQFGFHYSLSGYDIYFGEVLFELVVLVACGLIVAHKKRLAGWIQTVLAILLIAGVLVGFFLVLRHIDSSTSVKPLFQPEGNPMGQIFNIITLAPWAFIGFESVSNSSREFKFPAKKTFTILVLAIVTGYFAYTILADIAALVHPSQFSGWQDYIANLGNLSGRESMPVFNAIYESAGDVGITILSVAVIAGILTGIIGNLIASSRLIFSMAEHGLLPGWFRKQAKDSTPKNAVLFLVLISAVIPFLGRTAIGWIVDVTSLGAVIAYGYASAATIKLAGKDHRRSMQVTGWIGVVLAVVFGAFLMIPNLVETSSLAPESYLIMTVWSLLGFLFFRYVFKRDKKRRFGQSTVVWIVLLFIIFVISAMWMRQESARQTELSMHQLNEHYIEDMKRAGVSESDIPEAELHTLVEDEIDEIETTMTVNGAIEILLISVGLLIMVSVYSLIIRRIRQYELEKIKAEESSKAKSSFLSNMSHDIRTPMNAIIGYLTLAKQDGVTPEEVQAYLNKIETSSQHLLALINDVLEMSRIESGKMELEEIPTDLIRTMDEICDMFATQMSEKKITYLVKTDEVANRMVYCDKNKLNRVLLNLISNACKFTPEDGTVTVTLREVEDGRYELRVKDSGIGMSPEFAKKVFEAFERERTSTVSGIQGTGLGMAITKQIVDRMGGTIDVESAEGKGTEFIVRVPLAVCEEETSEGVASGQESEISENRGLTAAEGTAGGTAESAGTAEKPGVPDFSGKRVLLVDDMDINREIAAMMLQQVGFETESAVNGAEAVEMVSREEPGYYDAVLMDIQMPVMDGYEATRQIRALPDEAKAAVPVVAMTANAFTEDVQKAEAAGMDGHVAKPIDLRVLIDTLRDAMGE